ncbi:MAG: transcriptional regulator [candidate division Zixibacteria bacterium]|jgi:TrpR family trp operon transcriptional repressor|nr:transcriptional regulator [candidate division Zixibacteria bacterium]NIR66381.1 transcriptional regulator [candidate division Zixibacteria bacterium]NIS18002.1 transcriptional regulator [candidate division Zixibacteria bacterium]NIS47983.1 transcriptional regulator [candidate division Zixibacteria bacterium]NIT54285.1 transcriptional regulator [candidate division Zixibacteria bacterium]
MRSVNKVIKIFAEIHDPAVMRKLFGEIFTPAEIQDVALRWRLMEMLDQGIPQRKIASELGISLCKITRGSKILKKRNSVSKRLLNQTTGGSNASQKKNRKPAG